MWDQVDKTMGDRSCCRCGKELPPGSLVYLVNIRVFAGFDGLLLEPEEGIDDQLRQILSQIEQSDPQELEKEVYEEFTLLLCKSCRDRFVHEAQHPWGGAFADQKRPRSNHPLKSNEIIPPIGLNRKFPKKSYPSP